MDQLTEAESRSVPMLIGPLTRMAERVAGLEGRVMADVDSVKESIAVIRKAQHDTANHIQGILLAEQRCANGLEALGKEFSMQKDTANNQSSQLTAQIVALSVDLKTIMTDRAKVEGGWWIFLKVCLAIGFIMSGTGAAIGIIISVAKNYGFFH